MWKWREEKRRGGREGVGRRVSDRTGWPGVGIPRAGKSTFHLQLLSRCGSKYTCLSKPVGVEHVVWSWGRQATDDNHSWTGPHLSAGMDGTSRKFTTCFIHRVFVALFSRVLFCFPESCFVWQSLLFVFHCLVLFSSVLFCLTESCFCFPVSCFVFQSLVLFDRVLFCLTEFCFVFQSLVLFDRVLFCFPESCFVWQSFVLFSRVLFCLTEFCFVFLSFFLFFFFGFFFPRIFAVTRCSVYLSICRMWKWREERRRGGREGAGRRVSDRTGRAPICRQVWFVCLLVA